jgi:polyferredoxin
MGRIIVLIVFLLLSVVFGKFVCGKICPLGWIQEWVHKIPFPWKVKKTFGGEKILLRLKYVMLLFMVVSSFLGMTEEEKHSGGFWVSGAITLLFVVFIIIYKPVCKYVCPYGAVASLLNLISPYRYRIDRDKCIDCDKCARVCKMNVDVHKTPNHTECIRCGKCIKACPAKAIYTGFKRNGEVRDTLNPLKWS